MKDQKITSRRMALYAALLGTVLGLCCPLMPEEFRPACQAAARLVRLALGGF